MDISLQRRELVDDPFLSLTVGAVPVAISTGPSPARHAPTHDELDAHSGDRSFVMSFARGVSVIQAFAHVSRPLTIAEISHRTHIPRAAVRRLLHTLGELGYVKVVGLRFALTPKTLELGNAFASSNDVVIGVQPIVSRLSERLHSFCALSVAEGDDSLLVCLAGRTVNSISRRLAPGAGSKAPLYASSSGLVFLATYSDAQLAAYFARVAMLPITFRTQTTPEQVRESVRLTMARGYALCDRTFDNDLRSIAVPVHDARGAVMAALVAVVTADRLSDRELRDSLLPALQTAAQDASRCWR